ncbi:MAG: ABC transporter permease [Acidobacteriota bacterium]|nr:ABC transporter permease [Acidobacteriota bacterium]
MRVRKTFRFALGALTRHGLRTGLSLLGVTIGVAAVIVLTALTDGARSYVVEQFSSLGTNLVVVLPGRTETTGFPGVPSIPNDLTIADAEAIALLPAVKRAAPVAMGTETVSFGERSRQVAIIGTTADYALARQVEIARGEFLPRGDADRGAPVCVLGHVAARELFPGENPVGRVVRVGGWRMRVLGVLSRQGTKIGLNLDETIYVPVATGMQMLNRSSLFRILVEAQAYADLATARESIRRLVTERHGEEDVTVITQDAVLSTFSAILNTLTIVLAAIAAISLTVAGIGIMNVMLVSVSERTREIGLLRAVGVHRSQVMAVFLAEAALLSAAGALLGLLAGYLLVRLMVGLFPALPAAPPPWAVAAAFGMAVLVGVVFGLLPARRATRLDPVAALAGR